MIYLYDQAIVKDLQRSFSDAAGNSVVKVVDPEGIISLAAQIKEDQVSFPLVALSRDPDNSIDVERYNFTYAHKGVQAVMDQKTNNIYYEKVVPIKLSYKATILTTNTADMDEMIRELIFKYTQMYFLSIDLPYECDRKIRFGVEIDPEGSIERTSGSYEYLQSGKLYQSIVSLVCRGAVLVTYTPAKLRRLTHEIEPTLPS